MPQIENADPEAIALADWGQFKLEMLQDDAYNRVSGASDSVISRRIETFFAIRGEALGTAKHLWAGLILKCPIDKRPTLLEVQQWREMAERAEMPISFDDNGYLTINAENG